MNDDREQRITVLSFALGLWQERLFLAVSVLFFLILTGIYIVLSPAKYTASILINHATPVETPGIGGGFGMSGALSLLGNSSRDPKFDLFLTIIKTETFARQLEQKYHFIERAPAEEKIHSLGALIALLKQIHVQENADDHTATLTLELRNKQFAQQFLMIVYNEGNLATRRIDTERAQKFATYVEDRIKNEPNHSLQDALSSLFVTQERFLMVTKVDLPYAAQLLDGPTISDRPTSPKKTLLLAVSLFVGLAFGLALIMIWDAIADERRSRGYETAGLSELLKGLVNRRRTRERTSGYPDPQNPEGADPEQVGYEAETTYDTSSHYRAGS